MGPSERHDEKTVRQFLEADRLPGQPAVTAAMPGDALTGRLRTSREWSRPYSHE